MTIPLTGTGGAFTRVGREVGWLNSLNTYRGNAGTSGTNVSNIYAQFASTDQGVVSDLFSQLQTLQVSVAPTAQYIQTLAQNTLIQMVADDVGPSDTGLDEAVEELILQMRGSVDTVQKPTCSVSVTAGNGVDLNKGTGNCIATILGPDGVQQDYVFAETITLTCSNDSQQVAGASIAGSEPFDIEGVAAADPLDFLWPAGSGATGSINAVTADDNGIQDTNLLVNSNFVFFTGDTPDNWTVAQGTAGVDVLKSTTRIRGAYSVEFLGQGSPVNSAITQTFSNATTGQSPALIGPFTQYAFNCWISVSATPAAGVLSISLVDGSGGATTDEAGAQNTINKSLTAVTSTWIPVSGFFRTKRALPTNGLKLLIQLSTAIDSGKAVYIDDVILQPAVQLYNGGPFVGIFSESIFVVNDQFNVIVSNNYSSAWQLAAERTWGMRDLGRQLPSGGSPTILDSLIA